MKRYQNLFILQNNTVAISAANKVIKKQNVHYQKINNEKSV